MISLKSGNPAGIRRRALLIHAKLTLPRNAGAELPVGSNPYVEANLPSLTSPLYVSGSTILGTHSTVAHLGN